MTLRQEFRGIQIPIETSYWPQPYGWEDHAWTAWYEDDEPDDLGHMNFGYGPTQERAIANLMHRFPRDEVLP